jgi:hypothetical protein
MFGVSSSILIVFAFVFSLGILTLDFSVFETFKRRCAEIIATRFGLYDVYFDVCSLETLEMIRSLRHYEEAYCDSLVDVVAETLSLPEMLLILGMSHLKGLLNYRTAPLNLDAQAKMIADFYIDVARLRLWHPSPPSGPNAHRLCSRWRRRQS